MYGLMSFNDVEDVYQLYVQDVYLQLRFVLKNKDLKSKVRRINLK